MERGSYNKSFTGVIILAAGQGTRFDGKKQFKSFNNKAYKIIFNDLRYIPRNQLSKWSISWVLSNPNIISTVVGCNNLKQLNSNLDSLNFFKH